VLAHGLAEGQPFIDGNKRTAFLAMAVFLDRNGQELRAGDEEMLLADRLGDSFRAGLVLYTGSETLSFGHQMRCAPIGALWEGSGGH